MDDGGIMDADEIPCKLIPNASWRRGSVNPFIWYAGERKASGRHGALKDEKGRCCIAFDPVRFHTGARTLEEQMQLEEIKWMMGE